MNSIYKLLAISVFDGKKGKCNDAMKCFMTCREVFLRAFSFTMKWHWSNPANDQSFGFRQS